MGDRRPGSELVWFDRWSISLFRPVSSWRFNPIEKEVLFYVLSPLVDTLSTVRCCITILCKYGEYAVLFYWYPTSKLSSLSGGNLGQFPLKTLCLFIKRTGTGWGAGWGGVGDSWQAFSKTTVYRCSWPAFNFSASAVWPWCPNLEWTFCSSGVQVIGLWLLETVEDFSFQDV